MLGLKHNERVKVQLEDIATSHNLLENMKIFTLKEIEMDKILNLKILRDQSGLNSICPEFNIFME